MNGPGACRKACRNVHHIVMVPCRSWKDRRQVHHAAAAHNLIHWTVVLLNKRQRHYDATLLWRQPGQRRLSNKIIRRLQPRRASAGVGIASLGFPPLLSWLRRTVAAELGGGRVLMAARGDRGRHAGVLSSPLLSIVLSYVVATRSVLCWGRHCAQCHDQGRQVPEWLVKADVSLGQLL